MAKKIMRKYLKYFLMFFISANLNAQSNQIKTGLYVVVDSNICKSDQNYFTLKHSDCDYWFKNNPEISVEDFDTLSVYSMKIKNETIFGLSIKLTNKAKTDFKNITSNNIVKKIALIAENKIIIIPTVNASIPSGIITIQDSQKVILELEKYFNNEIAK